MKILIDESISIRIVRALRELGAERENQLQHVRELHGERTDDEIWLAHFAREGGKTFVSADDKLFRKPHQLLAIKDCGLAAVVFGGKFTNLKRYEQAAIVIYWWQRIERVAAEAKSGDCWQVPIEFSNEAGMANKKIDYESVAQKIRQVRGE